MKNNICTIGVVGYGRFGRLFVDILKKNPKLDVKVFSRHQKSRSGFTSLKKALENDLIIVAVPIRVFEKVIKNCSKKLPKDAIIMDVCSVKKFPIEIMKKYVSRANTIIGSHPLFGPGTFLNLNPKFGELSIALDFVRGERLKYIAVKNLFSKFGFKIIETNAKTHDENIVRSQFTAHIIAHLAHELDVAPNHLDTKSSQIFNSFLDIIQTDKQLLKDMYVYNPYSKVWLQNTKNAFQKITKYLET